MQFLRACSCSWRSAGFAVDDENSTVCFGEVALKLIGRQDGRRGIVGWTLANLPPCEPSFEVDGIPTAAGEIAATRANSEHPNGVCAQHGADHIVIKSSHWQRTVAALDSIGLEPLRMTDTVRSSVQQVFYRPSSCIIELVAPKIVDEAKSERLARLWGLTLVAPDLEATHAFLAGSTKPPWEAVQPGRQITVLQGKEHDISCAIALMSPHVSAQYASDEAREEAQRARAAAQEQQLKAAGGDGTGAAGTLAGSSPFESNQPLVGRGETN